MTVRTAAAPRTHLDTLAMWSGMLGSSVIALGSIVTALAYQGSQGQPYSPLNHFVSELGERAESELAVVFNTSLIIGGVCFVLFILGLAFVRRSRLRYVYGPLGVIAGVGGAFVGVFPMDYLDQHAVAALTFFNLGWIVVALASIDFVRNPDWRFPSWLAIIGAATVVAFVVFLVLPSGEGGSLAHPTDRADVWPLVIFEWLLLAGILVWVFATAFTWWRATRVPKRAPG